MSFDKSKTNQKEGKDKKNDGNPPTLYLNYSFYKVDPKWRWLNEKHQVSARRRVSRRHSAASLQAARFTERGVR